MTGWLFENSVEPKSWFKQGDLLRFEEPDNELCRYGIVVTADCDLDKRKHANSLTLVPVVSPSKILELYLLPEDCDKKRDLILRFVSRELGLDGVHDEDSLLAMMYEKQSSDCDPLLRVALDFLLGCNNSIDVATYNSLMAKINAAPKKLDSFVSQLKSRGDLMVLPETEPFGIKAGVCWMRHIWQVPASEIALRTSEVGRKSGERLARLDSPFRYRLTQLMGQVFSDIGLPDVPSNVESIMAEALGGQ